MKRRKKKETREAERVTEEETRERERERLESQHQRSWRSIGCQRRSTRCQRRVFRGCERGDFVTGEPLGDGTGMIRWNKTHRKEKCIIRGNKGTRLCSSRS